jgi:lambda repressor-like predicted transcriptional regulator
MLARQLAKSELKKKGWSNRRAAPVLGVTYPHLNKVLNGHRESRRLLAAIAELPQSPVPYMRSGFASRDVK